MQNKNILIYQNEQGNIKVDVKFEGESIWLTQFSKSTYDK